MTQLLEGPVKDSLLKRWREKKASQPEGFEPRTLQSQGYRCATTDNNSYNNTAFFSSHRCRSSSSRRAGHRSPVGAVRRLQVRWLWDRTWRKGRKEGKEELRVHDGLLGRVRGRRSRRQTDSRITKKSQEIFSTLFWSKDAKKHFETNFLNGIIKNLLKKQLKMKLKFRLAHPPAHPKLKPYRKNTNTKKWKKQ